MGKKPKPQPTETPTKSFQLQLRPGETKEAAVARLVMDPCTLAGFALVDAAGAVGNLPSLDPAAFVREVADQAVRIANGDLSRIEHMMVAQAHVLDSLFHDLAARAQRNSKAGYLDASETYMKLALRAQSQCRTTAETIGELKNPRAVAFVQQANFANGAQQVNNGPAPARESEIKPNELTQAYELPPDSRASSATSRAHPTAQDLGKVDGAADARGEGEGVAKRGQGRNKAYAARHRQGA